MDTAGTNSKRSPYILFIGKRFYTNRDALSETYGRIYQLPHHWAASGIITKLWLIDYHSRESVRRKNHLLSIISMPLLGLGTLVQVLSLVLFKQRYTHVVATGDCYIGLLGYAVAKRSNSRFIFDIYDKYDDFSGYRRPIWLDLFGYLLKRADQCMFASQALMQQLGNHQRKDIIVPNGIDTEKFKNRDIAQCRLELDLPEDALFIGYFGGMESDRGIEDLISAVIQLRNEGLGIELLIGGKANQEINLEIQGLRYQGNVPFEKMPLMLGACNLLAVPYRRSPLMDAGASNKIAEALACCRPIAATQTPNLIANFQETGRLLSKRMAEPSNPKSLAKVIRAQVEEPILGELPPGWEWSTIASDATYRLDILSRGCT